MAARPLLAQLLKLAGPLLRDRAHALVLAQGALSVELTLPVGVALPLNVALAIDGALPRRLALSVDRALPFDVARPLRLERSLARAVGGGAAR